MNAAGHQEYDRFGPWVDPVRSTEDLPRLFHDAGLDFSSARAAVKVPRNIDRRQATASMHLYEQILFVDAEQLLVLVRDGDSYTRTRLALSEIAVIEEGANFLDGTLTVQSTDGRIVRVPFNGSSRSIMADFVEHLRGDTSDMAPALSDLPRRPSLRRGELGSGGEGLRAAAEARLRLEPSLRLLGASAATAVRSRTAGGRLRDRFHPRSLQPIVLAANSHELVTIGRMNKITDRNGADLSQLRQVVDLTLLDAVETAGHPRYTGVNVLTLRMGQGALRLLLPAGSETLRALTTISARRSKPFDRR